MIKKWASTAEIRFNLISSNKCDILLNKNVPFRNALCMQIKKKFYTPQLEHRTYPGL